MNFGIRTLATEKFTRLDKPRSRVLIAGHWARSSAGERSPHTREAAGSNPAAPTIGRRKSGAGPAPSPMAAERPQPTERKTGRCLPPDRDDGAKRRDRTAGDCCDAHPAAVEACLERGRDPLREQYAPPERRGIGRRRSGKRPAHAEPCRGIFGEPARRPARPRAPGDLERAGASGGQRLPLCSRLEQRRPGGADEGGRSTVRRLALRSGRRRQAALRHGGVDEFATMIRRAVVHTEGGQAAAIRLHSNIVGAPHLIGTVAARSNTS